MTKKILIYILCFNLYACSSIPQVASNIDIKVQKSIQNTNKIIQKYNTFKSIYILSMGLI